MADDPRTGALSQPLALPERFGRYRIIKRLGAGGMGSVYLAEDTQLGRRVALKVPHFGPEDGPEARERFFREARTAATLDHPYLCSVYDVGEIDGHLYLTMAFIEGKSLAESLAHEEMPARQIPALVGKLALAMEEAHTKGVIHRDLKPANIMIKTTGQRREPVIVDFGLARRDHPDEARVTKSGQVMGTISYMAPEQIRGDLKQIGPACDIYALGVILYEGLTGRLPFSGSGLAVAGQVLTQAPLPLLEHRPDLDPRLEAICLKAMAKKVGDRYSSMGELAAAMTDFLRSPSPTSTQLASARPITNQSPEPTGSGSLIARFFERLPTQKTSLPSIPTPAPVASPQSLSKHRRPRWVWPSVAAGVMLLVGLIVAWVAGSFESPKELTNSIGMKLVLIPAGEFLMGSPDSDKGAQNDEKPQHRVRITRPFYLGVYEVTQGQYRAIIGKNPSHFEGSDDLPVEEVSWNDALEFCKKLSAQEGLVGEVGYRLPTEAEWEYACRAGSTTKYSDGDDTASLSECAWYLGNSGDKTHRVGQKQANDWHLYDMHGNVWEWCGDWYDQLYYGYSPPADPVCSSTTAIRVDRGGSWDSSARNAQSAFRYGFSPNYRSDRVGFRVARVQSGR